MSKISEQLASVKNENQSLELKVADREHIIKQRDAERAHQDAEIAKLDMELRRARKHAEVHETANGGQRNRGWFGIGGGEPAADISQSTEASKWRLTAEEYGKKLAEAERDNERLKMLVADVNEQRLQEQIRLSPMRASSHGLY